jgi:predicted protein tyrosine phosphatase
MLVVSGLAWARLHKRDFDAVITIEDPDIHRVHAAYLRSLRFYRQPAPPHLILRFYDLDYPLPEPYQQTWMRLAAPADVAEALAFARAHERLLVHCKSGVGRSAAIGLAILADQLHDPQSALDALLDIRSIAVPNRHVTAIADRLLGYHGTLLDALDRWDRSHQGNATRRFLCRLAHYYEFGVPLDVR